MKICTVANYLYAGILRFEDDNKLIKEQKELIGKLKGQIEKSVGYAKYSTQMLADLKGDYNFDIFDESKDYVEEIKKESKKIKGSLDLKNIDFKKPDDKWSKYRLVEHYETAYKIALLIKKTLTPPLLKKFDKSIIKSIERGYYMAYRICRKLQEYERHPKNANLKSLKYYTKRFKKLNLQRHGRKLVKTEDDKMYFDDGSIWDKKKQWIKESKNPLEELWMD